MYLQGHLDSKLQIITIRIKPKKTLMQPDLLALPLKLLDPELLDLINPKLVFNRINSPLINTLVRLTVVPFLIAFIILII